MRALRSLWTLVLALGACAHSGTPPADAMKPATTAQLLDTYWKLTRLGDQDITTPADAREIHIVLRSDNPRVAGYSGCNRLMGGYVLEGQDLRFSQMGGTMMACASGMQTEREFLAMFAAVAHWRIDGESLQLLDAGGHSLATFQSRYMK